MTGQNSALENRQKATDRGMIKIKASKAPKFKKGLLRTLFNNRGSFT